MPSLDGISGMVSGIVASNMLDLNIIPANFTTDQGFGNLIMTAAAPCGKH